MTEQKQRKTGRHARMVVIVLAVLSVVGLGLAMLAMAPNHHRVDWPESFRSNGERIYFTGTSASGQRVVPRGGSQHMTMMGDGCVVCHGADRQGGRMIPNFLQVAPPLTTEALFGDHAGDDGHGDHTTYTEATLRRAIAEGIDPDGTQLDGAMPRWSIPEVDMDDLVAFLKEPDQESR